MNNVNKTDLIHTTYGDMISIKVSTKSRTDTSNILFISYNIIGNSHTSHVTKDCVLIMLQNANMSHVTRLIG